MLGEQNVSIITTEEVSGSSSTARSSPPPPHRKTGSSKFRGVVPLPNGNWGCQIYANHQRIWLGTFRSENDAATAYDSAALKLRSADCRRNFPLTQLTIEEPSFQSRYSSEALISMIKDGTYQMKFAAFARTHVPNFPGAEPDRNNRRVTCTRLFQKELTPSDVGKLNRLVIPKKFAVKFFADLCLEGEENASVNMASDGLLTFVDRSMRFWKFRYCYWQSSHSYVFTRGWNRFVREKQLRAFDTIVFSLCECWENTNVTQTYYMIDVMSNGNSSGALLEPSNQSMPTGINDMDGEEVKVGNDADRKSFRLFGTEIV